MNQVVEKEHIEYFCKVMQIDETEIEGIYVNPGRSANNSNFVFVVNKESYLYRVPGKGTDLFCSREREALAYNLLKGYKITDEVIYLSTDSGIKISKYYENSRIPLSEKADELEACMKSLKKLHSLKLDFQYKDTLFDRMRRYNSFVKEVNGEQFYLDGFYTYWEELKNFEKIVKEKEDMFCFTHGDASINNFLITKEYAYPLLIDLEFPAVAHPFEDIATFCVDADYREISILKMLDYYVGRKATTFEQYHVLGLCVTGAMMWYSWAAYKCAVEKNNQQFISFRNDYEKYITEVGDSLRKISQLI